VTERTLARARAGDENMFRELTDLGRPAVRAHAARNGQSEDEYLQRTGEPLTPGVAGAALVELVRADPAPVALDYLLTGSGLQTGLSRGDRYLVGDC
jgi:hypothetical protein